MIDFEVGDVIESPGGHIAEVTGVTEKPNGEKSFTIKCSCNYKGVEHLENWHKRTSVTPKLRTIYSSLMATEYYQILEQIESLDAWGIVADNILGKVKGLHNLVVWQGGCDMEKGSRNYGMIQIFKNGPINISWDDDKAVFARHFYSQCEKLDVFKEALKYLLDHSKIKSEKTEKIEKMEKQINELQEEVKKLYKEEENV